MKPEQIRHIHRKVRHILFGGVLHFVPPFMLLIVGLAAGLLPAIPVYLIVRFACVAGQLKRKEESVSWKHWPNLSELLLGGASLATQDPIWFQLAITLNAALLLAAWILFGRSPFAHAEFPMGAALIGETPHRVMSAVFISGLFIIPAVNLWLALQFSETAWLVFRTLAFPVWVAALAILGTWLAARKSERDAQ